MQDTQDVAVIQQFTSSFTHQAHRETVSFFGRNHPLFRQVLTLREDHHSASKAYLQKHRDHDDVIDSNSQHICLMDTQRDTVLGSIRVTPGSLESRTLFDDSDAVSIPKGAIYEFSRLVMAPEAKRFSHGNLLMAAAAHHVRSEKGAGILALCKRANMKIFKRFGLLPIHDATLRTDKHLGDLYMVYASMETIMHTAKQRYCAPEQAPQPAYLSPDATPFSPGPGLASQAL
ncbi:hypothetical protein QQF40_11225 [Cobetia sp. LC6]|uniref:hypothetical protein n=1 Tax=Cobetia sp. LC6 TaxID=3050947 RepID=UPI00255541AA|nr:hypothetical protein [Cobetia sp. LC6]MDL2191963.1 hypothetical protein [Cobetia sp. LC6]